MLQKLFVFLIVFPMLFSNCQSQKISSDKQNSSDWLIPENLVMYGGVPKDGIPALTNPVFVPASSLYAGYVEDNDLVIGIMVNNEARAYPHKILDRHEIVNDTIQNTPVGIVYCPLTGSGIGWDRKINGEITEFGVSGLLYNSNVIPYDKNTDSYWTQMGLICIRGDLKGQKVTTVPVIETTWATWKEMFPETKVISSQTGYYSNYRNYPYIRNGEDYRESDFLIFPITNYDNRMRRKEKVHGLIIDESAKAYPISSFDREIETINDILNLTPVVVAGSSQKHFAVSFIRTVEDGTVLEFSPVQGLLPIVMQDNEGTTWDVFGNGVEGPRKGSRLRQVESFDAYWFAWGTFYPDIDIYKK